MMMMRMPNPGTLMNTVMEAVSPRPAAVEEPLLPYPLFTRVSGQQGGQFQQRPLGPIAPMTSLDEDTPMSSRRTRSPI